MFFKKEKVYTDRLAEYRKVKVGEFNLFDEVIVERIDKYNSDRQHIGKKFILLKSGINDNGIPIYTLMGNNGKEIIIYGGIKKSYGEFQEEFEALDETERLSREVQERLQKLEELKKKTDKIKDMNFTSLGI